MRPLDHFKTVGQHRALVRKYCFHLGLYWQGATHDLSKYSPTEFMVGAKYFQGDRSPNNAEREDKGYSSSWLHHKGRNKHHFEYWIDYSLKKDELLAGMEMPVLYVIEMFVDRIAACRTYQKEEYKDSSPWEYHQKALQVKTVIHPTTFQLLERLLMMLAKHGEEYTLIYVKHMVKEERKKKYLRYIKK